MLVPLLHELSGAASVGIGEVLDHDRALDNIVGGPYAPAHREFHVEERLVQKGRAVELDHAYLADRFVESRVDILDWNVVLHRPHEDRNQRARARAPLDVAERCRPQRCSLNVVTNCFEPLYCLAGVLRSQVSSANMFFCFPPAPA